MRDDVGQRSTAFASFGGVQGVGWGMCARARPSEIFKPSSHLTSNTPPLEDPGSPPKDYIFLLHRVEAHTPDFDFCGPRSCHMKNDL